MTSFRAASSGSPTASVASPRASHRICVPSTPNPKPRRSHESQETSDPRRIALLDKQEKPRVEFERNYSRMRRAFNRMEKARAALARVARQLDKLDEPAPMA